MIHKPVLIKEILEYLNPQPNENFIDATVGEAGHTIEILERNKPNGRVLGIDLDPKQIENSRLNLTGFKERATLVNNSYANIKEIVEQFNFRPIHGILIDLGMSSWQLEQSTKGFSFNRDEVLDMRYNTQDFLTAEKIVNEYPESEIAKILTDYGEEKFARQIAKKIVEQRRIKKIKTTFELKDIIAQVILRKFQSGRINYATKSFQALRIATNRELDNLSVFLPQALSILSKGGRLVVISFHSLEDRMVKNFFRSESKNPGSAIKMLTKKPITARLSEISENPRARSAKLRAIVKI